MIFLLGINGSGLTRDGPRQRAPELSILPILPSNRYLMRRASQTGALG